MYFDLFFFAIYTVNLSKKENYTNCTALVGFSSKWNPPTMHIIVSSSEGALMIVRDRPSHVGMCAP